MVKLALLAAGTYFAPGFRNKSSRRFCSRSLVGKYLGSFFTGGGDKALNAFKVGGAGAVITGLLAEREQQEGESDADYANRRAQVNDQLKVQFSRLYPKGENETPEDYDVRINALVEGADDQTIDVGNMAEGGRSWPCIWF